MTINLDRLRDYAIVAPDVETTGLHWYRDSTFGLALAAWDGNKIHSDYWDVRENPRVLKHVARELQHCKLVVNHNMKFDAHFLREAGVPLPMDRLDCTSVRAAAIDEWERSFSLDALGTKHVGMGKDNSIYQSLADLFGGAPTRAVQMKNLHRAPERIAKKYAIIDPEIAIKLYLWQQEEIKRQGIESVCDLERRLMPVLIDIESRGVRVDEDRAVKQIKVLNKLVVAAQKDLDRIAGQPVNANSPVQMRELFRVRKEGDQWVTDKGYPLEATESDNPSIGKDVLQALANQGDERARPIMVLRKMTKAIQFLEGHIIGHAVNGRVYPNYNQMRGDNELGTGTGRFSIDDPALQQIPARDKDIAAIVRSCFLPELGHDWLCADWEQFEFRWFAHYTKDPNILEAYAKDPNTDYHRIVAGITGLPRSAESAGGANAKQINLGLVFGMGEGKLAQEMGLPYTVHHQKNSDGKIVRSWLRAGPEAIDVFATYHGAIPGVKKLLEQASSIARSRGYVETIMGRRLRFPGGKFTHKAGGLVFQGTSADCMKLKMIELAPICKAEGAPYLLSVHDEHDISVPRSKTKKISPRIKQVLQTFDGTTCPIACRIPILSSVAVGPNWWEASK